MIDLTIQTSNIEKSFDRIARTLLEDYKLHIGTAFYQLTEIEFYYNRYAPHEPVDNFAHEHDERYQNGTWRLHGSGLDIVLKKTDDYYGGILIRGIQGLDENEKPIETDYIDGPWRTVTRCMQQSISIHKKTSLALVKRMQPIARPYKKSPRVGLFLKNAADLEYICKPWRYTTMPIMTKNYRHLIYLQLSANNDKDLEKNPDLVIKGEKTKKGYRDAFEEGKKMSPNQFVKQTNTVNRTCQLFGCYLNQMMSKELK